MNEPIEPLKANHVKAFWNLLKSSNPSKWIFTLAICLGLLETASSLVLPLFTRSLVDQLADSALEVGLIILLGLAFIVQTISSGFSYYFMTYLGESVVATIRKRLWDHIIHLPIPYFDEHESGETMSRVSQDTNTVKTLITQHLITFVTGIISIIGAVTILLIIDWKMTLIMIISVPLAILVIMPLGQKMYKISKATQDEMALFTANLGRVLADIRLVKAYHAENTEKVQGEKGIRHLFQYGLKEARILAIISPFMTFIMMFVLVVLIGYGGVRVASGALSAGSLVAIIIYMFQIVVPFSQMATFFTSFQKAMGATERIQEILSTEVEPSDPNLKVQDASKPILFQNVSFSYKNGEQILKNVSFVATSGNTTAFVGPSGSGKTTLFALLERFYEKMEGNILQGDQNIHDFELASWRSQIGYVSQESPIMSGTIRQNITYGMEREISDEDVLNAAKLANAAEFIERLPKGFETEVGERGMKLSGGQRQRIAIARALIKDPKILLLDEATSNLDSASEELVQKALSHLMKGRTTLIIAHRLSTVVDADQIIVLEQGEITGIGTHHELIQHHDLYRRLAEQQLKNEKVSH
ncbi:ABC transporter ATP-binding protein [Bacillaceae bacterium CLA-AA-H227]|uniref:ABC transporter ATP-binding protein n=1 Tax=Robertmurraya yapensis (ex Hitch et al 2024) TaxID=3133160 RepID=A0ACC6SFE2_9BACI